MARGCTGVAANYKNNTANQPPPSPPSLSLSLFDRTIAGSLARAVDADVADVLSFWSCEKFETHLTLFSSSSLIFLLSLSLFPSSFSLSFSSAFHPEFSWGRGCPDTSDYVCSYVRLIGSCARTSLFFFKLHDDRVFLLRVLRTYVNRRSWGNFR